MIKHKKHFKTFLFSSLALILGVITLVSLTPNNAAHAENMPTNSAITVSAEAEQSTNKITVIGNGEVEYVPNVAKVSVGVETLNMELTEGQKENSDKINKIVETLVGFGVLKEDIKTNNFNVYPRYNYSDDQTFMGYQINNTIEFKMKNIENLGEIIAKTMENGANSFHGVNFTVDDYDAIYLQSLDKALTNAINKAKTLAKGASKLTVLNVEEISCHNYMPSFSSYKMVSNASEDMTIYKGKGTQKATIKVEFSVM